MIIKYKSDYKEYFIQHWITEFIDENNNVKQDLWHQASQDEKDFILAWSIVDDEFIEANTAKINFHSITDFSCISEKIIDKYKDKLNWRISAIYEYVSEKFLDKNFEYIHVGTLLYYKKLSEKFLIKHVDLNKYLQSILHHQILSEQFIIKYMIPKFFDEHWQIISYSQNLSEQFIEKYQHKLEMKFIFRTQEMSNDFMQKLSKGRLKSSVVRNVLTHNITGKYYERVCSMCNNKNFELGNINCKKYIMQKVLG